MKRFVYFLKPIGMDGPIKIGCSITPVGRLLAIAAWSPFPLEIAATIPGGLSLEKNIHECFADLHLHREWFKADPKLVDAVALLAAGVPIESAIDLTKRVGKMRGTRTGVPPHSPDRRRYISYMAKARWARVKATNSLGIDMATPLEFDAIMSSWDGKWVGDVKQHGQTPTAEQIAYLDDVLANRDQRMVPNASKYRSRRVSA